MKMIDFRPQYEPFRGKYYEFANYRIHERYLNGKFVHYECEHAGNVFTYADLFEDAVNKCRRHAAAYWPSEVL